MRHISITPVLGVGITDLRPVLDDEVYIQRDYPDGEVDHALTEACLATERHEMREEQHERICQAFVAGDDALVLRLWDVFVRHDGEYEKGNDDGE